MNEHKAVTEFDKGNQLLQERKLEDAIAAYRHAIELNPANSWFHQQLGEALAKLGRFDEAVTAFYCAIELKPDFSWSYHHLGDALAQQQKWEQAAEAFGKGIQLNPEHFGTYVGLGNTLAKLGQLDDAIAAYRRARELNPDADWIHHALANALQQRTQLDVADAIVSHDQLEIHQAEECLLDEVIASYLEAVKQSPETFDYCHRLGETLVKVNQPHQWEKAIALYQSIITQRSDLVWAHHFLGDALRNTQQWEAACQAYRKAIFLKPDFFWSYLFLGDCAFELGQKLEQAGQLQEAIASYLEAVKQSPETFDYCHQLGAILAVVNQPQMWEKAIALYQSIITKRSDLVWAHHFLGDALRNTQQWEAACQAYRKAIFLKPDFFWSYLFLGDSAKELQQWEEVITAHQRAVELKPETTNLNNNIGEAYYQVGKKYREKNQLEKAVQCYQKALETQHSQKQAYYDLREAIGRELYELGFQNAEVGLVSEGVAVFEKISMMETKRENYEYLWQGLNSLSLATLDETSRYCQNKIELEEATNYFQHTSDYKVIDMCALTADDKEYIQRVGLFLPALELIAQDNLTLEEIYINNFKKDDDSPLHLAQQVKRASNIIDYAQPYTGIPREEYKSDWQKGLYLQQSIVETGYVYTVCPFSGKVLRSNQSLWWGNTFYRFVGKEVFYLLVGDWFNTRISIYIPRLDLIIKLSFPLSHINLVFTINVFKGYMVTHWSSVKSYILSEKHKKIAGIVGCMSNLSHYVWNDITGIYHLYANDILSKVDAFLVGSFEYFKLNDIFPEVETEKIIHVQDMWEELWQLIANNNYISVRLNDFYIKEDLARKIYASSSKKCSSEFLLEVKESQKCYPLLWVGIRTQRAWLSQIEGLGNTIKSLYADFPNLGVVFDGWSRLEKMEIGAETVIDEENAVMEKIKKLIQPSIKTYSAIGYTNYEKVIWTDVIDLGITSVGAGLTVVSWISNKPCVVYGNTGFCNSWYIEATHSSRTRENGITPVFVPTKYIVDCDDSQPFRRGYEFDWKILYNLTYIVAYEQARERHKITDLTRLSLEQLLAHYQEAIAANPEDAALYFELGQKLEQSGQLQEAITSYLEAVKRSPETFDYCHRLGELLARVNQPQHWENALALYQSIIMQKPDLVWAHHFLGDAFRHTQQWEAASQAYQSAISLKVDFFWSYLFLGDCAKELQQWEEVLNAYQCALEIKPEETYLHDNIGEAYYQLGKKYIEQNQLEKAEECYQKMLEKQPYPKLSYYDLRDAITKTYHQLGIHQAEQGLLYEAIVYFQKATTIDSTQGEVYEYLWQGLNQESVTLSDKTSHFCNNDIQREAVEAYFSKTCTYKIINWWELNTDDKEYIKKAGLSLVQIEFSIRDQRNLEKIYMKSFGIDFTNENPNKQIKNGRMFQQSIAETGYIYTICPFTGKVLRSNQSFVIGGIWPTPVHIYRFAGQEIFYLLVGDWIGDRMYIYIPSQELIIKLGHLVSNLQDAPLFNKFKGYMVSHWKEVISYLSNPQKEVAAILGFFSNIGHYTWNDLTGIQYLHERHLFNNIDKFIVGSMEYFNISDIWPENIPHNKRIQVKDPQNLFNTVLVNNCFTFRITNLSIKEDLANRISKGSYQRCSQEFLQQINIAKQHFPLVCFQIRFHIRFWLSQIEGIANIIKELSKDYPNLGVVFDGWSRTEIDSPGDNEMIALENGELAKIIDRLDARTNIYNAIGCRTYEKVLWAQAVDTYIAPSGSGLTFLSTIANKMGVVHGDSDFYHNRIKLDLSLSRENGIPPLLVSGYHLEGDQTPAVHRNYECDWSAIYDEVVKIVQSLQPER